jgi:hypothetical protein
METPEDMEKCRKALQEEGPRVKHVLNSLAQIEAWICALRSALSALPLEMELPMPQKAKEAYAAQAFNRVNECCPPPEDEDCED